MAGSDDEQLRRFSEQYKGKNKVETINLVGRGRQFVAALKSPIGKELLSDLAQDWANLLIKIVNGSNTDEERMKFIVLDEVSTLWAKRIAGYYEAEGLMEIYLKE